MPSVLECVSETQTKRVWPAGFGVSYGIGSTLKQTQRSRNSHKVKTLTSIISHISTNLSRQKHPHIHWHTSGSATTPPKTREGPRCCLKTYLVRKGRLKYTQDTALSDSKHCKKMDLGGLEFSCFTSCALHINLKQQVSQVGQEQALTWAQQLVLFKGHMYSYRFQSTVFVYTQ